MIAEAIQSLRPNSHWGLDGDSYEGIQWFDQNTTKPTQSEIETEIARLQQERASNQYKFDRTLQYPAITDQLDMLWHMMDDETIPGKGSDWYNSILAVKQQFPKP